MLAELQETATQVGVAGGGGYAVFRFLEWLIARARGNGNGKPVQPGHAEICQRHDRDLAAGGERFTAIQNSQTEMIDEMKLLRAEVLKLVAKG